MSAFLTPSRGRQLADVGKSLLFSSEPMSEEAILAFSFHGV